MSEVLPSLKDIVKDNTAYIHSYRAGNLYYKIQVDGVWYTFPVPTEDCGDATFQTDKAMLMMRYIRKAIGDKTFVKLID